MAKQYPSCHHLDYFKKNEIGRLWCGAKRRFVRPAASVVEKFGIINQWLCAADCPFAGKSPLKRVYVPENGGVK